METGIAGTSKQIATANVCRVLGGDHDLKGDILEVCEKDKWADQVSIRVEVPSATCRPPMRGMTSIVNLDSCQGRLFLLR